MNTSTHAPEAGRAARRAELRAAAEDPLLGRAEVEAETGLSRSTIHRHVAAGTFPPPLELGGGWHRWPRSRIRAWKIAGVGWRDALPAGDQP